MVKNDLYLLGGIDENSSDCYGEDNDFSKISLSQGTLCKNLQNMPDNKSDRGICHYRGEQIYSICGIILLERFDTCERYNIAKNCWEILPNTSEKKHLVGCTPINNAIYIFGGKGKEGEVHTIEKLPIQGKVWQTIKIKISPDLVDMSKCHPIYMGSDEVLIAGINHSGKTNCYIVNLKKAAVSATIKLGIEPVMHHLDSLNDIYLADNTNIVRINKNNKKLTKDRIANTTNKWKKRTFIYELDESTIQDNEEY